MLQALQRILYLMICEAIEIAVAQELRRRMLQLFDTMADLEQRFRALHGARSALTNSWVN